MAYAIGVDSSTTVTKAAVWDESGRPLGHEPDPDAAGRHDRLFDVYQEIYPRTKPLSARLREAVEQ